MCSRSHSSKQQSPDAKPESQIPPGQWLVPLAFHHNRLGSFKSHDARTLAPDHSDWNFRGDTQALAFFKAPQVTHGAVRRANRGSIYTVNRALTVVTWELQKPQCLGCTPA